MWPCEMLNTVDCTSVLTEDTNGKVTCQDSEREPASLDQFVKDCELSAWRLEVRCFLCRRCGS